MSPEGAPRGHALSDLARALTSFVYLSTNTLAHASVLLSLSLVKLVAPGTRVRRWIDPKLNRIAASWIAWNARWMDRAGPTQWIVTAPDDLSMERWYLILANHLSWVDIFALQRVFNRRIPMLKFFLKRELIWVPVIGLAWWALDFPFMRRHSQAFLAKNPHRRGDDLTSIRNACRKFELVPTSVMNFAEGTRFTAAKKMADETSWGHLLRPRTGGVALALDAMGERFHALLDVTIYYPGGAPGFLDLLAGRIPTVVLTVEQREIPATLLGGNCAAEPVARAEVQKWLHGIWDEKDRTLRRLAAEYRSA